MIGFFKSFFEKRAFENMKKLFEPKSLKVYELYFDGKLASQAYLIESERRFLVNFINR